MSCRPQNELEMADIFNKYWDDYVMTHNVSRHQHKVIGAIKYCRTGRLGSHIERCSNHECDYEVIAYNSCRDRHCPKCSTSKKLKWVSDRMKELLPIPYYHFVSTMPDMISMLCLFNPSVIYDIFFKATSQAINAFSKDPKFLGAQLGFVGVLHTWGKSLWHHPHIHYIITGGGLKGDKWINLPYQHKFLFPVKAVSKTIRGRFIKMLKKAYAENKLVFPGQLEEIATPLEFRRFYNKLGRESWYCYAKKPFSGPEKVLQYIGRYTHRVAISNGRLIDIRDDRIVFRGKDYKDQGKQKVFSLDKNTFIQRFLWHILPSGFRKIRHFGFLNTGFRSEKIQMIREQFEAMAQAIEDEINKWMDRVAPFIYHICPKCHKGEIRFCFDTS